MTLRDIGPWLFERPRFQDSYRALVVDAARDEFEGAITHTLLDSHPTPDWDALLLAASFFAGSAERRLRDAALRIAVRTLRATDVPVRCRDAAGVILDVLANTPTLKLAVERGRLASGLGRRIPLVAQLEWVRRELENQVSLSGGGDLAVNQFQRQVWDALEAHQWVSFTAPTSAGKSYVVTRWVLDYLARHPDHTVAYVVPTRALISEVEHAFRQQTTAIVERRPQVTSLPVLSLLDSETSHIVVVTQERLHLMLPSEDAGPRADPPFRLDVLVVDEAHKIGDRHRGVLLQQVIERATALNPAMRVVFASPGARNPDALIQDRPASASGLAFGHEEVTVNQNLLWVSPTPGAPQSWQVDLQWEREPLSLGTISTPFPRTTGGLNRLALVAFTMGERLGGNVVYVNGAADAEKAALLLRDLRGEVGLTATSRSPHAQRVQQLVELTRRTIHPRFILAQTLPYGIAFHYGNLPLLIREEIERLFRDGALAYLVCTSTLVEGVNTACRSIFIRAPKRGARTRMSTDDFWNLAGRAGRWGREFQGNVVCLDPVDQGWGEDGAPRERTQHEIEPTTERLLREPRAVEEFLAFVAAGTPRSVAASRPDLEFTYAYLASRLLQPSGLDSVPWMRRVPSAVRERVATTLIEARSDPLVSASVVWQNPGFSPLAMDALLRYFRARRKPIDSLLPPAPGDGDAARRLAAIFGRLNTHLNARLGPRQLLFPRAILVTEWMRGRPLGVLINARATWAAKQVRREPFARTIRAVLEEVEQIARFEAPRSVRCYLDVLRLFLRERDAERLLDKTPNLSLFLELGVYQETHLTLMGLGFSRTATLAVAELIVDDRLDRPGVLRWLAQFPWRDVDLPLVVQDEIRRVLQGLPNTTRQQFGGSLLRPELE